MNILLIGTMGSGKDHIASLLEQHYDYKIHKLGRYIRKHVDEIFSYLDAAERRTYYQQYGETLRENISIDIWNDACFLPMNLQDLADEKIVIADARQPHEITYWSEKGFIPVGIDVSEDVRLQRLNSRDGNNFTKEAFQHSTEINAANIVQQIKDGVIEGYVIDNNGDDWDTLVQITDIFKVNKIKKDD